MAVYSCTVSHNTWMQMVLVADNILSVAWLPFFVQLYPPTVPEASNQTSELSDYRSCIVLGTS